jgi:hypothetical protein
VVITREDFGILPASPALRTSAFRLLGDAIVEEWRAEARAAGMRSTLGPYLQAIQIREVTADRVVVSLPGPQAPPTGARMARMMEFGMGPGGIGTEGPYDIRTFLLRASTRKIKWGKNGPYLNVPFDLKGAKGGVGHAQSVEALGGLAALRAARALGARGINAKTGRWERGGALGAGWAPKQRPHHAVDALVGTHRLHAHYSQGVTQTSAFRKWRVASWTQTDPAYWKHPGIKARRLGERVAARLPELIADVWGG